MSRHVKQCFTCHVGLITIALDTIRSLILGHDCLFLFKRHALSHMIGGCYHGYGPVAHSVHIIKTQNLNHNHGQDFLQIKNFMLFQRLTAMQPTTTAHSVRSNHLVAVSLRQPLKTRPVSKSEHSINFRLTTDKSANFSFRATPRKCSQMHLSRDQKISIHRHR